MTVVHTYFYSLVKFSLKTAVVTKQAYPTKYVFQFGTAFKQNVIWLIQLFIYKRTINL